MVVDTAVVPVLLKSKMAAGLRCDATKGTNHSPGGLRYSNIFVEVHFRVRLKVYVYA